MKNLFKNIRLAFSAAARNELINSTLAADAAQEQHEAQRRSQILTKQGAFNTPNEVEVIVGSVTTADLLDFNSKYARNAVAQLGAWSAIARGFSAFVKNPKDESIEGLCQEFHAWNAAVDANTPDGDEETLLIIQRLSQVKPAKGDKQTDAIIARVLKKSIEEVKADREAKALVATKKREEAIINFNSLLWSTVYSDGTYSLPAHKVMAKLEQTLVWMAGWDTTNPSALAAELLLVEADIKYVKQIARREAGAVHDFEEGVMAADTISRNAA